MLNNNENNNMREEQLPLDAKLLTLVIIELNISRRNVAVYPENHPSIKNSIEKAYMHLERLFEMRPEITLAVAKDTLIVDEHFLDKNNPVYKEFAASLYSMGLASITFVSGITEEEIRAFHRIITTDPEEIKRRGGIKKALSANKINHIRPALIDYSAFHFVEDKKAASKEDTGIWEDYAYGLLKGKLLSGEDSEKIKGVPPDVFARIINQHASGGLGEGDYEKVIANYLRKGADELRLKKGSLSNIMNLVEGLKPSLKKQFLSSTFSYISPDPSSLQKTMETLSPERLMDMMKEINERDEIIPETLNNLLKKLSKIKRDTFTLDTKFLATGDSVIDDIRISDKATTLLERDRFDDFITDTYKEELNRISAAESAVVAEPLEEIQSACDDEYIDRFIAELLLSFLETSLITEEEAEKYTHRFIEYIDLFLQTGRFEDLAAVFDAMTANKTKKRYVEMTDDVLAHITSKDFIDRLIASYRFWGRKNRDNVVEYSKRLKGHLIAPLLDALSEEENAAVRRFYLSLAASFGKDVVPGAIERLADKRWYVQRNMLYLLRECGDGTVLKHINPFCEHSDIRVAFEAVKAYLHFGSPEGIKFLKRHLHSNKTEIRDQALKLAGGYRIKPLVPDLIKMLIKKDILGGDFHLKIPIVWALGNIGDARALHYLFDICKEKSILYKAGLEGLKVEIYHSLKNYPAAAVKPFVEEGLRSKNDKIAAICKTLSEQAKRDGQE